MFENESKGWHGSYSLAGRSSAEKYHLVINKDKIVSGKNSKIKVKGFFSQEDEPNVRNEIISKPVDIFEEDATVKANEGSHCLTEVTDPKSKANSKAKKHSRPLLNVMTPSCTKYNPKRDFTWKRALIGPEWEKVTGRPDNINKTCYNDPGFYIAHDSLQPTGKVFVDMKMQTQRGPFRKTNDVRYRTDVPFVLPKVKKGKKKEKYLMTDATEKDVNITFYNNTIESTNENSSHQRSAPAEVNAFSSNRITKPKPTKQGSQLTVFVNGIAATSSKANISRSTLQKCPDFKKTISRAYVNYLNRDRTPFAPFFTPNYSQTTPRTLTMVTYDRSVYSKGNKELRSMGIDPSITFNPDEAIKKINSRSFTSAPNFATMTSRPNNKTPLPFYMQQTFDRNSFYITSAKTLMMNNYSNGKFISNYDTFFPKKSFNKVINMNLLSSEKFVDSTLHLRKPQGSNLDQPIIKAMRFYRKNLDDNVQEGNMGSFDAITLKSVPKKHVIDAKERKRFEVDYNYE